MQPKRVILDKIASATVLGGLKPRVDLSPDIPARIGAVVAGRVLNSKTTYNTLEDEHGRFRLLMPGDVVAGVLGFRNAMHGYVGHVPDSVSVGDELNILNLGGVIGSCTSFNPDVGRPYRLEILGSVLHYHGDRESKPLIIERSSKLETARVPAPCPPVVLVVGTAMNSGKTTAVCQLLRFLKRAGKTVAAAKVTGVSLLRDTLEMRDSGASRIMSFMDLGVITTAAEDGPPVTRAVIEELAKDRPDVILLELGDGLLGRYGVGEILSDPKIQSVIKATALCASDPVGAWGGVQLLRERFDLKPCAVTGPVSDNRGGAEVVEREFGIPAKNARREGEALTALVLAALEEPA